MVLDGLPVRGEEIPGKDFVMNHGNDFILIAGIPGTGKSVYSTHLRDRHGYHYVEADVEMALPGNSFIAEIHPPKSDYVSQRTSRHDRFVLEFGFPPAVDFLQDILALKSQGARLVWFTADIDLAKAYFSKANGSSPDQTETFRAQVEGIQKMRLPTPDFLIVDGFHGTTHLSNTEIDRIVLPRRNCGEDGEGVG